MCRKDHSKAILLDSHSSDRFERAVAGSCEVVHVSLHLDGFQPLADQSERGEIWSVLVKQWAYGSEEKEEINVSVMKAQ